MVVDTSAVIAILFGEPEEALFVDIIESDSTPKFSVASLLETTMLYFARRTEADLTIVTGLTEILGLQIVAVDSAQASLAISAFLRFGKGRHPARLNMGDCFSYALAASLKEPLLFKGADFSKTDIAAVLHS